jgi:hypothetical protein
MPPGTLAGATAIQVACAASAFATSMKSRNGWSAALG